MRWERIAARCALLVGSIAFALVLLELGARAYLHLVASDQAFLRYASLRDLDEKTLAQKRSGTNRRYVPHRYLGYYPTPDYVAGKNRHNSLGFRGDEIAIPKPQGEFRIACLGGSTTYTQGVTDYHDSYPDQLQAELGKRGYPGIRVVNAGGESYASWESLINLELRVLELEPDLVIDYDCVNDVHARFIWPPAASHGDNSGRRAPNAQAIVMPSVLEYSTFLRILLVRSGRTTPHADLAKTIDTPADTWRGGEFRSQWYRARYPRGIFKEVTAAAMLAANPPVHFRRNLTSIAAVAKAHGAGIVFATYAYSPNFERRDVSVSSPEYIAAIAEMNDVLRSVAAETDSHLIDLAATFPTNRRLFQDGEHVNRRGATLMARQIADELIAGHLLPAPVTPPALTASSSPR